MSATTPIIDVTQLTGMIMPLISVFITIFLMTFIFKSLKDVFTGL